MKCMLTLSAQPPYHINLRSSNIHFEREHRACPIYLHKSSQCHSPWFDRNWVCACLHQYINLCLDLLPFGFFVRCCNFIKSCACRTCLHTCPPRAHTQISRCAKDHSQWILVQNLFLPSPVPASKYRESWNPAFHYNGDLCYPIVWNLLCPC